MNSSTFSACELEPSYVEESCSALPDDVMSSVIFVFGMSATVMIDDDRQMVEGDGRLEDGG